MFLELKNEETTAPYTPRDIEEKGGTIQELYSSTKNVDTHVSEFRGRNWRQRTRPKNKQRMNMKVVLDSKFQKDAVTIVEYSLSDEDPQIADIEHYTVDKTLDDIKKEHEHISELSEEGHKDKGKQKNI